MFTDDDQAVKVVCDVVEGFSNGIIETWNLAPDTRPVKDLIQLAQLLSLRRLDLSGVLVPLDVEAVSNAFWTLHQ
jgi:hypothetical protein